MRVKTSVTLSEETLAAIDRVAGPGANRSRIIEEALQLYLAARRKAARSARDRAILDRRAEAMNAAAEDALDFQAKW